MLWNLCGSEGLVSGPSDEVRCIPGGMVIDSRAIRFAWQLTYTGMKFLVVGLSTLDPTTHYPLNGGKRIWISHTLEDLDLRTQILRGNRGI
jgi:hypothetical protein